MICEEECENIYLDDVKLLLGDLNGDGGWNVLDIVTLSYCVLEENCAELENGWAGGLNSVGEWSLLDIVILANCVLYETCVG